MSAARLAGRAAGGSTAPWMVFFPCRRDWGLLVRVPGQGGVRAENRIHGSDQQSCPPGTSPVVITHHVPAVRVPPDHATSRVAAAVPARGGVDDRRNLNPAPPARRPAAPSGARPEADVGGPGRARGIARRDTESPPPRIAASGHPGHDPALAPRHPPAPPGGAVDARQVRPAGDSPEH
jgi:hypothetical protein